MNLGIAFSPLVPLPWLYVAIAAAGIVALLLVVSRTRGAAFRALALGLAVLALANPALTHEEREPLPAVVAVVVDKSPSQNFGERRAETEAARAELAERLARLPNTEVRWIDGGEGDGESDGTRLFEALESGLADVPPERIAGAILITDGRVHDVPAQASALGFKAPLHALVTGRAGERDRRIALVQTPRFGIVGQSQTVAFRVEDEGTPPGGRATVTIRRDGDLIGMLVATTGEVVRIPVEITHAGPNIVEIEATPIEGELTPLNNRAAIAIDGVREKLRVLLVSGEPHAGERTWRNLLKSDAAVDLIHFTILRPPEKQDGTPINELSLIAFPTRELFQQKIGDFDLIIFDRYTQQGVLPLLYFENIARYVRGGGAVLVAAGPDYASSDSIFRTPLEGVLPAEPTGNVTEKPFHARLTEAGRRHPVTRSLDGASFDPPRWSRFFRVVDTHATPGSATLLGAPEERPVLVLAREGEGRVALILSDHIWLWARGYEGGGPHLDLLRRLSHWLMKEPELEEERLRLLVRGRGLLVERQSMTDAVPPVTLTSPSGQARTVTLASAEPGIWRAEVEARELGLWRANDGTLSALVNVGPINPREVSEVTSTTEVLAPIAKATGGGVIRIAAKDRVELPRVLAIRGTDRFAGNDWIGLRTRDAHTVTGLTLFPVLAGLAGLLLLLAAFTAAWVREGR
ncbi:hypothetical protein [Blastochloris sulfoviridis]|uniref:Glutamine amidotransferase domain-containing protein n=1 Tax=Blastochloris sulfoviridis TaxID=50712 RepID=A0A5M6I1X2_9HYPH|nr:hypothetical protein [Blastochloris sulfoviridis]KAA5602194.1 hypothetical protein F1193_06055 [Blastochloris sulfoviridis]